MTVSLDDGKDYVLHAGDSLHFGPGTGRACKNTGVECAEMITVMIKK
jgi:quercetin dioxygenase-like cupin family protein